jgi:hypothetical protein
MVRESIQASVTQERGEKREDEERKKKKRKDKERTDQWLSWR